MLLYGYEHVKLGLQNSRDWVMRQLKILPMDDLPTFSFGKALLRGQIRILQKSPWASSQLKLYTTKLGHNINICVFLLVFA